MKTRLWQRTIAPALLGISLLLLLAACGQPAANQPTQTSVAPATATTPDWVNSAKKQGFRSQGQYIAAEATIMADSLYGNQTSEYYANAPTLAAAIAYWKHTCQNADGSLCTDARSGSLQCVEFITGVFASIDDTLPYIGDANRFWQLYQNKTGWQEIPATTVQRVSPALGDLVAASGGSAGHLALVVDLQAPTKGQDGTIVVAQANAPEPFERLTWHTNGRIDAWSGYQLQGFIRQQEIAPCLQQQVTPIQQYWATLAMQVAVHYGTPAKYFLRQICQSGFQGNDAQGHTLISATGARGIAQLPASIAAQIPRCVINFVENAQTCARMPGSLPAGVGIDPASPQEALPAAAYIMSTLYTQYQQNKHIQDNFHAYIAALAAYNAGAAVVDAAINTCSTPQWLDCLDQQQTDQHTRHYIEAILDMKL